MRDPLHVGALDPSPLFAYINERHAIYLRRALLERSAVPAWASTYAHPPAVWRLDGEPALTEDPILQTYRFCNVFRELDRVTVWIRENVREPFADHEHLWFMLAICRYVNWPPCLAEMISRGAWPSAKNFTPARLGRALLARRKRGEKVETGAYMIRPEGGREKPWYSWPKQRYIAEIVLGNLWRERRAIGETLAGIGSVQAVCEVLASGRYLGWGDFMAYEVATDLRHTGFLGEVRDAMTWANPGPGARRGLNRLAGRPAAAPLRKGHAVDLMHGLLQMSGARLAPWVPPLEMRDIEHSLCEIDKYERARSGAGRPRARYVPGRGY